MLIALLYDRCSFRRAGQEGPLTRLLPCTKEELKTHTPIDIEGVNTYVAPSFAQDSEHDDRYPPYNKPGAITHWLRVSPGHVLQPHDKLLGVEAA